MEYNEEKFENVVLFIAKNGGIHIGKKKLAKLLYFIDFTLYEIREESLTGMNYVKGDFGPMPEPKLFYGGLESLVNEDSIDIEDSEWAKGVLQEIIAKTEPNMKVFDEKEKKIIKQKVEEYRNDGGGVLEKKAQDEPPYKMVKYDEEIPYHLAFYRNSFGEMNLNA